MNEQFTALLGTLAGNLGVATEVLWGAMLRQATISSVINCIILVLLFVLVGFAARLLFQHKVEEGHPLWLLLFGGVVVTLVACWTSAENIVSGLVNPEYWALSKILEAL